jgi:4-aminobutyrate aminotransferase
VQGEGGYVVPPRKFHEELQRISQKYGILLILDEVQAGMGRTGKMWASEHFGIVPDILTSAKGIASGMPLSATIARKELMQWKPGSHASTFGGNPVCVAAALVTVKLLERELIANAAAVGAHIMDRLRDWARRYPNVGDVRGLGLMIGIELVDDQSSREPAPALRDKLIQLAFERGVLLLGASTNVIRLSPPLVITRDQADFAIDTLEDCLETATSGA